MKCNKKKRFRVAGILSFALTAATSYGQSFNVDLDVFAGDAANGNGAPSNSFGGAAGQPGLWNRIRAASAGPYSLQSTSGASTGVAMTSSISGGIGGGSNLPINTGDFALLLNDYTLIPDQMTYRFSGLQPGAYRVFTYAVNASGSTNPVPVQVSVDGAMQGIEVVTGPMPGNSFGYLITHSIHDVPSLNGDLVINLAGPWPNAYVNGFQIMQVPEGGPFLVLAVGSALAVRFGGKV